MAIITFWSDTKKQVGQTMSIVAIATNMAIEHNYKILLISTKYNDDTLELCFGNMEKNKNIINKLISNPAITVDNGIEGLSKIAISGKVTPDIISNYTHIIYRNRLEILYGFKERLNAPVKENYLKSKEFYKDIIQNANKQYDMVFVDLDKNMQDDMVKQILKISDLIVYNIEQKIDMLNHFLEIKNKINTQKENNIIVNIGRFDSFSKYTVKNISRYLGMKRDITVIPYNTLYFEAAAEANVANLLLKIRKVSSTDRNAAFVKEVKDASEKIIYKLKEIQMRM